MLLLGCGAPLRRCWSGEEGARGLLTRLTAAVAASPPARRHSLERLLEPGSAVNAPRDACGQSPVHLAAQARHACFLLWQLQAGADLNQQDAFGEAPIHKAAKVGSLECLSLLVASDALIDLCNKNGQTAEDLAWSCGFLECAKFLTTVKHTQSMKLSEQSKCSFNTDNCGLLLKNKRAYRTLDNSNGKKQRSDDLKE